MPFIEAPTTFYLGRRYDQASNRLLDEVVYYDSRDLTTHAVVVGMTGSGKTGMCISLLEEAVLDNIPALIIDPKGDITNLLLTFPELRPQDFAPWVNESDAQRARMDVAEYAQDVAQQWKEGLARWSIGGGRVGALKNAAQFSIYTPGSDAGLPVSILASLQAPRDGWVGHEEFHREQINGIVRALLGLIGKNVNPVKDKEHVLISNIFEEAWKNGRDLTLEDIIMQVQNPPFARLGVFDVNTFFKEKDRFKLAQELNNIVAAPSFQTWINGEPLDMRRMLYTDKGKARVSIFYLAHLNDAERTFIITLLLENVLAWMRTLSGTTSLRAIIYFDEVFGHFPPAPRNPPTKDPMLRILKQARAFGIGAVLATQNPGDLDYKGLSNAGSWFIGKLQTENDKKRVLGGLESVATADSKLNLQEMDKLISNLAPRVFLLHNVHDESGPVLLHSRWAMSYLRGPLTRQQVRTLMADQRRNMGLDTGQMGVPQAMSGQAPAYQSVPVAPQVGGMGSPMLHVPQRTAGPSVNVPPPPPPDLPSGGTIQMRSPGMSQPPTALPTSSGAAPSANVPPPPPPDLPDEKAGRSTTPATPPPDLPDAGPTGGFLDKLKASARPAQPPQAAPEPPAQPKRSFLDRLEEEARNNAPQPAPTTTPDAGNTGATPFWLEGSRQQQVTPPPSPAPVPSGDSTVAPGYGYTVPNYTGGMTVQGPALPQGYDSRPPALPSSVAQYYLPTTITMQEAIRRYEQATGARSASFGGGQLLYMPVLFAQLAVRYIDKKSLAEADQFWAFHVPNVEMSGFVRWNDFQAPAVPMAQVSPQSFGEASYGAPTGGLTDAKRMRSLRDEVIDYVSRTAQLKLFYNSALEIYGKSDENERDFVARLTNKAREARDAEIDKVTASYDKVFDALDQKLRREMRNLTGDKEVLNELRREDLYTTGEAVMSLMRGRTAYTLSRMSRARRYKKQAQEKAISGEQEVAAIEDEIEAKQQQLSEALREVNDKWSKIAQTVEEYVIRPFKKDIALEAFGIGWLPQWYVVMNGQALIFAAFGA